MNVIIGNRDENKVLTIAVEGSIDTVTSSDFENNVINALDDATKLIIDFENQKR